MVASKDVRTTADYSLKMDKSNRKPASRNKKSIFPFEEDIKIVSIHIRVFTLKQSSRSRQTI